MDGDGSRRTSTYSERNTEINTRTRAALAATVVVTAGLALTGCSTGGGGSSDPASHTLWDSFTQYDASSP